MNTADNVIIIPRDVKHARLRVSEDLKVRVIVPPSFSQDDIDALLAKKKRWIEKNLNFFHKKSKIELQHNQLLLFGKRYSYFYDTTYQRKIVINHEFKTIRARRDLLDTPTQERWYKSLAKKHLSARTQELSENLHFSYNHLYIRSQRTKWGNCSEDKNISLNWRLIKAPEFVIDYLIVHELVHTRIMNHTGKFRTLLKSLYPDYKDAIKWLDKYGNSL